MFEIKHRFNGKIIFRSETAASLRDAVLEAVRSRANLARANLAGANLADANLAGADLADAYLADADLAGADLADADLADAYLARAYLAGADLADANLAGADLAGAYLAGADLAGADLADADLADAYLAGAYLAGADLADAKNVPSGVDAPAGTPEPREPYRRATTPEERKAREAARAQRFRERNPSVPVIADLDRQILEIVEAGRGVLDMSDWHHGNQCGTTHCRAGWAIHLAGDAGYALEKDVGPFHAGRQIYLASTGRAPHFYGSTERALEDIRRCAEEAAKAAE